MTIEEIAYAMARHIRNTDKAEPIAWGMAAIDLLGELQKLDPARYEAEVKEPQKRKAKQ